MFQFGYLLRLQDNLVKGALLFSKYRANEKAGEVIRLTPCIMLIACSQKTVSVREVWTKEQANEWYKQWGWLRGCDFIPSTAINQMEM